MNKNCGKCVWFEPWPWIGDDTAGTCRVPKESVALPKSYHITKRNVWAEMDLDCPFWEEK